MNDDFLYATTQKNVFVNNMKIVYKTDQEEGETRHRQFGIGCEVQVYIFLVVSIISLCYDWKN